MHRPTAGKHFNRVFCMSFDKLILRSSATMLNKFALLGFFTWSFFNGVDKIFFSIPYCLVGIYFKVSEKAVDICISTRLLLYTAAEQMTCWRRQKPRPIFHDLPVFKWCVVWAEILVAFVYGLSRSYTTVVVESAFFPRNVYRGFYSRRVLP